MTSRRRFGASVAALAASSLLLVGCSGATPNESSPNGSTGPSVSANYGETHTLVLASNGPATTLDPAVGGNLATNLTIIRSIYSSLTQINADGELVGDLAESWEQTGDTTWRFTLRDDAKFSDGTPVTAEVVKWNLERVKQPEFPGWIQNSVSGVESVEVVSDLVVDFHTKATDLDLPRRLVGIFYAEPTWVENNNPAVSALGSGPYKLVSFNPDSSILLERNEDYYGPKPEFKNAEFRVVTDAAARLNGLISGELDYAHTFTPQELAQLESANGVNAGSVPTTRVSIIRFNTNIKPFDDTRVRAAVNYAIDKEAITKAILAGQTEPAKSQIITPFHEGYNEDLEAWPYDPDKARELLAEAGYPDGFSFELLAQPWEAQYFQVIVEQLAEVGLKAELELVTSTILHERGISETEAPAAGAWGYADTGTIASETLTYIGSTHFHTIGEIPPAFDEAVAEAQVAKTKEEQLAAIKRATQAAVDDALAVFLWARPKTFGESDKVEWQVRRDDWVLPATFTVAD